MIQREPGTDGLGSTASHLVISSRPTLCGSQWLRDPAQKQKGRPAHAQPATPNLESLYPVAGFPSPASWVQIKDVASRCRPSGFHRRQMYPQLTCRLTTAHLYTHAPICSQLQPTHSPPEPEEAMGIIFPKGGIPLSDRSCLNLERKDGFCYPLPAANIWGPLFVTMQASRRTRGQGLI